MTKDSEPAPQSSRSRGEMLIMVVSVIVIVVLVQMFYSQVVGPRSQIFEAKKQSGDISASATSLWVVIRDPEQRVIFMLGLIGVVLVALRRVRIHEDMRLLDRNLLGIEPRDLLHRDHVGRWIDKLEENAGSAHMCLLPQAIQAGLERFRLNGSVDEAAGVMTSMCESEMAQRESELAWINYIAWAIPSVGFIGTVRGIGQALALAGGGLGKDITPVTDMLGVAFNSTFVALLVSMALMFLIHWIRRIEEHTILRTDDVCRKKIAARLYEPETAAVSARVV